MNKPNSSNNRNFLLGRGERLTKKIAPPRNKPEKTHPYTFDQAKQRVAPLLKDAIRSIDILPATACPRDEVVAIMTLHPAYVSKSYFPDRLLPAYGLRTVGSRSRILKPERSAKKNVPEAEVATDLFVAGTRSNFRGLARDIDSFLHDSPGADDLTKIEDFHLLTPADRVKSLEGADDEPVLEVILHLSSDASQRYIVDGFIAHLRALGVSSVFLDKSVQTGELCFVPIRAHKSLVEAIAEYSYIRTVRQAPRLRPFTPTRSGTTATSFPLTFPTDGPLVTDVRAAVFDGGVSCDGRLSSWVTCYKLNPSANDVPRLVAHGTAVTSAVLFGPLDPNGLLARPYCPVDHYRALDDQVDPNDPLAIYDIIPKVRDVLRTGKYAYANFSFGPDYPVQDDDIDAWTVVLDEELSTGNILATVAVGNNGHLTASSAFSRIQPPSDAVNVVSVGAADSQLGPCSRADYSCFGPGRSPGLTKPEIIAFGGSCSTPFWVVDSTDVGQARPEMGTSFAAPYAMRTAIGIGVTYGNALTRLTQRALLVHNTESNLRRQEVGWGRIQTDVEAITTTNNNSVQVVYQGELDAAAWLELPVPLPAIEIPGMVTIKATVCFATEVDSADPANYTRSGVEVKFRPSLDNHRPEKQYPETMSFFQARDCNVPGRLLRADAHRWETVLTKEKRIRGSSLKDPMFNFNYVARDEGGVAKKAPQIPYSLVVTITAPKMPDLYNRVFRRYRTTLEPIRPVLQVPVIAAAS